jgi:3-hydroxyacyl-CoA dehydrogenase/enoyl-CoA hydratase/3-hydroxybutyryl-CoA epimerase
MKYNSISLNIENNGIANLIINLDGEKVNKLNYNTISDLEKAINVVDGNRAIRALLITSTKENNFIAGADINEIKQLNDTSETIAKLNQANQLFTRISNLKIPTIAVIEGSCLGGGLELALSCQYRVAVVSEKTILGLPEVNLGIIPGFGGTQRLPVLIGLTQSLKLILTGKPLDALQSFKIGLVDEITHKPFLNAKLTDFVSDILKNNINNKFLLNRKKIAKNFYWQEKLFKCIIFYQAKKNIFKATKGNYPAPFYALEVIKRTYKKAINKGLIVEKEAFVELVHGAIAKNLIELFFIQEEVKKIANNSIKFKPKKVALVGSGIMGGGIAWLFANKNINIVVKDISNQAIALAYSTVLKIFNQLKDFKKITQTKLEQKILNISPALDYHNFYNSELIIEAVVENIEVKQKVLQEIESSSNDRAIIVSNTSSLSINQLSSALNNPSRFAGLHFFNPVNKMPLVEIIAGENTSSETINKLLTLSQQLGKTAIVVKDVAGFLVNRILLRYLNESMYLLQENIPILAIDNIIEEFGLPMGPFTLADTVGLDIGAKVANSLQQAYGERMKVALLLNLLQEKKILGKKTNAGFYLYIDNKKDKINPQIATILQEIKSQLPHYTQKIETETIINRCIYSMINEASKCLEEQVVENARYLDLAMIFGIGFPAFRGGLLRYADSVGIVKIVDTLQQLEKIYGNRFSVSELLLTMAKNNAKFYH